MDVHVRYVLAHDGKTDVVGAMLFFELPGKLAGDFKEVICDVVREFPKPLVMFGRNDERMARTYRMNIWERNDAVVFVVGFLARHFTTNYVAEDTISHSHSIQGVAGDAIFEALGGESSMVILAPK